MNEWTPKEGGWTTDNCRDLRCNVCIVLSLLLACKANSRAPWPCLVSTAWSIPGLLSFATPLEWHATRPTTHAHMHAHAHTHKLHARTHAHTHHTHGHTQKLHTQLYTIVHKHTLTKLPLRTNVTFWSTILYGDSVGRIHFEWSCVCE